MTAGMGSAAFVAYLSGLCNIAFTATQYALLTSLAAVGRTTLSASGGALADAGDIAGAGDRLSRSAPADAALVTPVTDVVGMVAG